MEQVIFLKACYAVEGIIYMLEIFIFKYSREYSYFPLTYRSLVGVTEESLKAPGEEVVRRNPNGDEHQWKGDDWAQYVWALSLKLH